MDAGSLAEKMRSYQSGITLSCPCNWPDDWWVSWWQPASLPIVRNHFLSWALSPMWHTRLYDPPPCSRSHNQLGRRALMRFYSDAKWISAIGINLLKIFIEHRMRQSITSINSLQNSNWNLYSFHLPMDSPPTAVSNKFDCDWESNNFKLNKIFVLVY